MCASRQHDDTRSRSPRVEPRRHRSRSRERKHRCHDDRAASRALPLNAQPLSKHDLVNYRPLFALYLDVQKRIYIDELEEEEVRGRWKSFLGKWNRGELAEGWYDAQTYHKAVAASDDRQSPPPPAKRRKASHTDQHTSTTQQPPTTPPNDSDDEYGPSLPTGLIFTSSSARAHSSRAGPSIPTAADLRAQREDAATDAQASWSASNAELRASRRADRTVREENLDSIAPRAEPGTRERQLEKKRERAAANASFAAAKGGGEVDVPDADVFGADNELAELRRMEKEKEKRKTQREIEREEMARAKRAEFEERMRGRREKEEKVLEGLRAIARERFG